MYDEAAIAIAKAWASMNGKHYEDPEYTRGYNEDAKELLRRSGIADRIEQLEAELAEDLLRSNVTEREAAAYKRGMEEAAKIVERKHRIASDAYLREEALGLRSALNAIRAKIQENDG